MEYPRSAQEWDVAMQRGLGLDPDEARRRFASGTFEYEELERWLRSEFAVGFDRDFVPALTRNMRGLVCWVYGDGHEPYWPGGDDEG